MNALKSLKASGIENVETPEKTGMPDEAWRTTHRLVAVLHLLARQVLPAPCARSAS